MCISNSITGGVRYNTLVSPRATQVIAGTQLFRAVKHVDLALTLFDTQHATLLCVILYRWLVFIGKCE